MSKVSSKFIARLHKVFYRNFMIIFWFPSILPTPASQSSTAAASNGGRRSHSVTEGSKAIYDSSILEEFCLKILVFIFAEINTIGFYWQWSRAYQTAALFFYYLVHFFLLDMKFSLPFQVILLVNNHRLCQYLSKAVCIFFTLLLKGNRLFSISNKMSCALIDLVIRKNIGIW